MGRKCCVPNCKEGYKDAPKDPDVTFMYLIRSGNLRYIEVVIGKLQKIHLYAANISFQLIFFRNPKIVAIDEKRRAHN